MNAPGYLCVMFAVDDFADTPARLREHGAQLVGEVVNTKPCIGPAAPGPEGILIGLAELG